MAHWDERFDLFRTLAADDLEDGDDVFATVVGFNGDHGVVLVGVRDFLQGTHIAALTEALSLPWGLGCSRFCVALAGRAWSLDDPIPPVAGDADLRQRVVAVEEVAGGDGHPRRASHLLPFTRHAGGVTWHDRVTMSASQGPVGDMLAILASRPPGRPVTDGDVLECIASLDRKGHAVNVFVRQP